VIEVIGAEVDSEAIRVRGADYVAVSEIVENIVMREGEAATALIGGNDLRK
jgi:hypothetical protein